MRPTDELWKIVKSYSISSSGYNNLKIKFSFLMCSSVLLGAIAALIYNWNRKELKYLILENIERYDYCFWLFLEHSFYSNNIVNKLKITEENYFNYEENMTQIKSEVTRTGEVDSKKFWNLVRNFCVVYLGFSAFFPLLISFINATFITLPDESIIRYDLLLPDSWFPCKITSYSIYLMVITYHLIFSFVTVHNVILNMGCTVVCLDRMSLDIKLLKTSFSEIDYLVYKKVRCSLNTENTKGVMLNPEEEVALRRYFKQLIQHHNLICRNLKVVSESLALSSFNMYKSATTVGCVSLYCFFEMEDMASRIKYAGCVITIVAINLFYGYNGQLIKNEGEELRLAIYNCSWLDKPLWVKKTLIMLLTRTIKSTEIKPIGLYALNFDFTASIFNAAYAYCNFLRTSRSI